MPIYCYRVPGGEIREIVMSVAEMMRREKGGRLRFDDGTVGERDIEAEHRGFLHDAGTWPQYSDAAGVHPDQIAEATEHAAACGVPTDFKEDGRAIFTSRAHRRKYCEVHGLYDRDAGYSDAQNKGRVPNDYQSDIDF